MKLEDRKISAVLDTNIYISAFSFPGDVVEQVIKLAIHGEINIFISQFIIDEFEGVLREKFSYSDREIKKFVSLIKACTTEVHPKGGVDIIEEHKDDNQILDCALEAEVDFLITGDKKHILPLKKDR